MSIRTALALLATAAIAATAHAAQFVSLKTGIAFNMQNYRFLRETTTVTNLDWPIHTVAHYRNTSPGERYEIRVTPPDGSFTWTWSPRPRTDSLTNYYVIFHIRIAGTPNEQRTGIWTITATHQGQQHSTRLEVTQASREVLDELRAAPLDSFVPAYRLGAAASMFGENDLAIAALQKAASLAPRSPYPHVALCRHYLRIGQKEQARQSCAMARGLILGYEDRSVGGWLMAEIETLLKQAGE